MEPSEILYALQHQEGGPEKVTPYLDLMVDVLYAKFDSLEKKWRNRNRQRLVVLAATVLDDVKSRWGFLSLSQQQEVVNLLAYAIHTSHVRRDDVQAWTATLKLFGLAPPDVLGVSHAEEKTTETDPPPVHRD